MSRILHRRKWMNRASSDESSASEDSGSKSGSTLNSVSGRSTSPVSNKPSFNMSSHVGGASGGTKLAQEIHDEFLVCKICLDSYKSPKCLSCLHTFCEQCIDNHVNSESSYKKYSDYREFTCPLCRKRTQLPVGGVKKLPDNFLVSSLTEVVGRQRPSKYPFCDICKMVSHKHREASSKCLDCAKLLCSGCVQMHRETKVTSGHSVFDVEIEKEIECKEHENEVVRFYCEPCDACVCVMCTFNTHKDHNITQFSEAVVKYKDNIQLLMVRCKDKIDRFDAQLESLNKCEGIIKTVEQNVHDKALEYIQEIRDRERQIIEELQNIYGPDCMEQLANKKDLVVQIESLRSTCNLTDVILTGKDIELLLLKKDVQEKLDSLSTVQVKDLPATTKKVVEFVSGTIDLGYLHDYDRPLLSKMRSRRANTVDLHGTMYNRSNSAEIETSTMETQTDPELTKLKTSDSSDESSSDGSDESSDGSDDSDSESEKYKKFKQVEAEVQTESSCNETDKADNSTMTDPILLDGKVINTTSQGITSAVNYAFTGSESADDTNDNSLAARRRRRRERAQTAYFSQDDSTNNVSNDMEPYTVDNNFTGTSGMSLLERRKLRSTYVLNHHSVDGEDVFYDAMSSKNH